MADEGKKLTKRMVDAAHPAAERYILWDTELKGFGLRVETSGTKSYLVRYRAKGGGAKAAKKFITIGQHGRPFGSDGSSLTPDSARREASRILGLVANGRDPAGERDTEKGRPTLKALLDDFLELHGPKLKPNTALAYARTFRLHVLPRWGKRRAEDITSADLAKLHATLAANKATANRILNYLSAAYVWGSKLGYVSAGFNPTRGIERYTEGSRERFLTLDELDRLGNAIREAETVGVPWGVDEAGPKAKHAPKEGRRLTPIAPAAAAALRLLLFTGARLREVLHLEWKHVDVGRAALFLPDSKTGRKTIYLNAPALEVLQSLPRSGRYVFPGEPRDEDGQRRAERPRADLKRPWEGVRRMAGLDGFRIHDLRHTHASFGVGGGLGLPIIGKLLGHAQTRTTEKYSHLDADPIRLASEAIGKRLAEAMGERRDGPANNVTDISSKGRAR